MTRGGPGGREPEENFLKMIQGFPLRNKTKSPVKVSTWGRTPGGDLWYSQPKGQLSVWEPSAGVSETPVRSMRENFMNT